jgi:hypothetical protein
VVLNKIDTLWDTPNSAQQIQDQLERQRQTSAEMLGVRLDQVLPVSAQKGLVAKIQCDDVAAGASGRRSWKRRSGAASWASARPFCVRPSVQHCQPAHRTARCSTSVGDLDEQMLELRSLRGKNSSVIPAMRNRIEQVSASST